MTILIPVLPLFAFTSAVIAQSTSTISCSTTLTASYPSPSVVEGWEARLVANNLQKPRGILFDSRGQLLVVESGKGISALTLNDHGGTCVSVADTKDVIQDSSLSHGIELSADGQTLYASSPESVSAWSYSADSRNVTSEPRQVVTGMASSGHETRTLLLSRKVDGMLLVSFGSQSNVDTDAEDINTGVSQIRAFNISNTTATYDFKSSGLIMGWGLRNSVGVAEEPLTGGIYSVENSVDNFRRDGKDIHQDNPGEEMNFHGYLNGTAYGDQGGNYGYPTCFAAWDVSIIPNNANLTIGTQFAMGDSIDDSTDIACQRDRVPPVLSFQAHMAPLDIKFNSGGNVAWITFHGSWNRDDPAGYKLSVVEFSNGSPVALSNSSTALIDVMANADNANCPDNCFRPVGLAWDSQGRLFMSSDSTNEIYVIARSDGSSANDATPTLGLPSSSSSSAPTSTTSTGNSRRSTSSSKPMLLITLALGFAFFGY